ncbi:succinylglutamate desuccinylase/aspartoacylase family protein [Rhodoferax sp.]|uniref:succinylglutamate desuccinylase/aspartoacylase family protein n=1 Tax=Rhodoferax sp. TaxID=50421 RepID=UPI0025EF6B0A|nr:succinylglutamate desuccinylase/aspartoacylase family protein [Rhodoferax sp.]
MQRKDHPLLSNSLGSHRSLSSFHYGTPGLGPKVYVQASLHAEELPGMLAAYHLRALLDKAEAAGQLRGEVILVPVANPIGLAQRIDHKPMGRFELDSSENFNRHYPDLAKEVYDTVKPQLDQDAQGNVLKVRRAMAAYLQQWQPATELQSLRKTLLLLAHDADHVIDLHCDCEGVMHFYTEEPCWPQLEPLAHLLQAQAILLARNSGSGPFDECLSGAWWQLAERLKQDGLTVPLPQGCNSTTVELRGEADVSHTWAQADAQAVFDFLCVSGAVHTTTPVRIPAPAAQATPLAGSETLRTPCPGVVAYVADVGRVLQVGDLVAEVINPIENTCHPIYAGVAGVFYARVRDRYAHAGAEIGKIAGATAFRTGELLGA